MLKITNLKSGYDKMEVLKGLDFEVGEKEIVAVIGPNGYGKSTLLKSIFNLCEIYYGHIEFEGKNITRLPTFKLITLGISYVPQGRQIFGNLTVRENLEVGMFFTKTQKAQKTLKKNNIKNLIETKIYNFFPFLKNKEKELAKNLSGGQQQMLALARALIIKPKLLLLDEPSLGLSPKITKDVFEKIKEINSSGVGIVIVEQNAKLAVEIADRTYVLEDGQIALTGGKEILSDEKIKDIYFGGR